MIKTIQILFLLILSVGLLSAQNLENKKLSGYRGIWFELGQKYVAGDKYSGALGTYTAKHVPLAIYSERADKTFFVYGGTTSETEKHLLCMIGEYDHKTGMISLPTIVCDKNGVDDPHDNPSLLIDDNGYIWVFVSGRGSKRPGFKYRSTLPFNIERFDKITEEEMTYPQPRYTISGYFHFFTKYTGVRQLYFETSTDGKNWTDDKLLAAIPVLEGEKSGHYQTSNVYDGRVIGTFFNRHPNGIVDRRTDLYYVQTTDFGKTWTTVDRQILDIPLKEQASPARVIDYASQSRNVYLKDMEFDAKGNPVILFIRSYGHEPGNHSAPYEWCITKWNGSVWETLKVTESDHNYDMGSLFIGNENWIIVGPTEPGPQAWGVGGELAIWISNDDGKIWEKETQLTRESPFSHSYVRKVVNGKSPFNFFWADGHSHQFSKSQLYFGDFDGNYWRLPYFMQNDYENAEKVK